MLIFLAVSPRGAAALSFHLAGSSVWEGVGSLCQGRHSACAKLCVCVAALDLLPGSALCW